MNARVLRALSCAIALWLSRSIVLGQSPYGLGFIPASIEEVDLSFPLPKLPHLSAQMDVQMVTQGAYTNPNPFAYVQRLHLRPWVIYDGLEHWRLWGSYSVNHKYAIKEAGNRDVLEQRITLMGSRAHLHAWGGPFEQVRFDCKFFEDGNGIQRTIPRIRLRGGYTFKLGVGKENAPPRSIGCYLELMLKFAPPDYAESHFDIFRMSAYYTTALTSKMSLITGALGQIQLRANDTQFDVYFGPFATVRYAFAGRPAHEQPPEADPD